MTTTQDSKWLEEELEELLFGEHDDEHKAIDEAIAKIRQHMLSEAMEMTEDYTHFHRTCQNCGKNWWGLHCPHDGYQNPCPECKTKPTAVNQEHCDCEFVAPVDEIRKAFTEKYGEDELVDFFIVEGEYVWVVGVLWGGFGVEFGWVFVGEYGEWE
jgi:hypothetical protein